VRDGYPMFNPTQIVITAFIRELREMYDRTYGTLEPGFPGVIGFVAQLALENIATSDAPYHDVSHTIMVTLVGQEILRGRHISVGGISPRDWLHFIISLLCHDIGYVRGICQGDENGRYVSNLAGDKVGVPEGATDASLTPYHVAPEEKKPDPQAQQPPIGGESVHGSEGRSDTRSLNRIFSGKASYYSYQTGKTASGVTFDRNLPTAAHRSLPFGTKVRVTDLATNKSVVVVITDRGPKVRDRVLDLSLAAARSLGITDRGVAQVRVEVL